MKRKTLFLLLLGCSLFVFGCFHSSRKLVSRKDKSAPQDSMFAFLFLSDVHLNADTEITCMGDDAGKNLWAQCAQKLDAVMNGPNPPKFIVYTGDLPVHYSCKDCKACPAKFCGPDAVALHNASIKMMLTNLGELSKTGKIPVLYAPGNNDALMGNYYPFSGTGYSTPFSLVNPGGSSGYPYSLFGVNKPSSLKVPYMISDQNVPSGYWSVRVMDGLRVICLNTVIWGTTIKQIVSDSVLKTMAKQEMKWLSGQLDTASRSGDRVFLAMHIPPGVDVFNHDSPMWNSWADYDLQDTFLMLTEKYSATVTGIFYGHTHYDELRLLYNRAGTTVMKAAISCPGISTAHSNYPAFKVVQFDRKSKVPMDFTTYFTPLHCKKPAKIWGDSSYRFSVIFGPDAGLSIYDRLMELDTTQIQQRMSLIYRAGNGVNNDGARGVVVKWTDPVF